MPRPFRPCCASVYSRIYLGQGVAFWRTNGLKLANPSSFLNPSGSRVDRPTVRRELSWRSRRLGSIGLRPADHTLTLFSVPGGRRICVDVDVGVVGPC